MAASRKKRAKAVNTSPSTVLVIFLVFFILLSIGLGVWGYYSNQTASSKEKAGAGFKTKGEKDAVLAEWFQMQAWLLKTATGQKLIKDETKSVDEPGDLVTRMGELDSKFANMPDKAELVGMKEKFKKDLGWNDKEKVFPTNYVKINEDLKARIKKLEDDLARKETDLAALKGREDARDTEAKTALTKLEGVNTAANKNALDETKKATAAFAEANEEKRKALETLDLRIKELEADFKKRKDLFTNELKEKEDKITVLTERTAKSKASEEKTAKTDLLAYDVPKGKIVRIDFTGKMPYINLGRADGVREQLTFSVFGRSPTAREFKDDKNPKATYWKHEKEVKASLEVVKVIDAHLSQARITYMRDLSGDPLETGDVVYNPTWNPNQVTHVAIAGIVDFTGEDSATVIDQVRGLKEFINNLERQNIHVDAFLNLRDLKVEGQITLKTDYFILAEGPQFDGTKVLDAKDEKVNSKAKVSEAMEAMRKDAIKMGVTVIPLAKFAIMTGYRLPRATRSSLSGSNGPDGYGSSSSGDTGAKKPDEDKPKDPKDPKKLGEEKPDMKKEEKEEKEEKKKEEEKKKDKKKEEE